MDIMARSQRPHLRQAPQGADRPFQLIFWLGVGVDEQLQNATDVCQAPAAAAQVRMANLNPRIPRAAEKLTEC